MIAAQAFDALPMAGMKPQFGKDQRVGKEAGVVIRQAKGAKPFFHKGLQAVAGDACHRDHGITPRSA